MNLRKGQDVIKRFQPYISTGKYDISEKKVVMKDYRSCVIKKKSVETAKWCYYLAHFTRVIDIKLTDTAIQLYRSVFKSDQ